MYQNLPAGGVSTPGTRTEKEKDTMIDYTAVRKALLVGDHGARGVKDLDSPYAPAVSAEQITQAGPANVGKLIPIHASTSRQRYANAFAELARTFKLK